MYLSSVGTSISNSQVEMADCTASTKDWEGAMASWDVGFDFARWHRCSRDLQKVRSFCRITALEAKWSRMSVSEPGEEVGRIYVVRTYSSFVVRIAAENMV